LLEALALISESRFPDRPAQFVLEACAAFMAAVKDWSNAARLYGTSEAQRERLGVVRERADEGFFAPLMAQVREALGETDYLQESAAGRQLPVQLALSEAQAWLRSGS